MIKKFKRDFGEALAQRAQVTLPSLKLAIVLPNIITIVYLVIAVMIAPENHRGRYFKIEAGMVTYLSGLYLALASNFSRIAFNLSRKRTDYFRFFWLLTAVAFAYLFLDEVIGFHDGIDKYIDPWMKNPKIFRGWNDLLVILYGVVALFVMAGFLPEIFRYPRVMELMGIAFLFYFIHTFVDATQPKTQIWIIIEESAKVFCGEFLAISMFVAILGMKAANIKREK